MPSNLVNPNPPIQLQTIFLATYRYVPSLWAVQLIILNVRAAR
jgi:energy-coupling factor transporter transmembrane protein EcfT